MKSERVRRVAVDKLRLGFSPRFGRLDEAHVAALQEVVDRLPPILITPDGEVIDGAHRLTAARRSGRKSIRAVVFTGDDAEVFAEAVRANIAHGKPLSERERNAAVRRLLGASGHWSDRRIADACGMSASTVATIRRSTEDAAQSNRRLGRDGRERRRDAAAQRVEIANLLARDLQQPLRRVAAATGCSPATVLDVRDRLRRGEDPVPPKLRRDDLPEPASLDRWTRDHAFDASPEFAAWFEAGWISDEEWARFVTEVPLSRVYDIADEANKRADSWRRFATAVQERAKKRR